MSERRSRAVLVATLVVATLVVSAIVVVNAPANWLARGVARATNGVLLLADADGTIWSGSAVLALGSADRAAAQDSSSADASPATGERLALPGRVIWRVRWEGALAPVLQVTHDGVLPRPVTVRRVAVGWSLDPGTAVLPATLLGLAGTPLNTLLPDGRCELHWNALAFAADGAPTGDGTLSIDGLALALSPVRPLGAYVVTWTADTRGLAWRLATARGPLMLSGDGIIAGARSRASVVARVAPDAPPAVAVRLAPLLDLIGRRGANEAVIRVGRS